MSLLAVAKQADRARIQHLHDAAVALGASCHCAKRCEMSAKHDDGLVRFNPNHYGPGERGGQFAPAGEGGSGYANTSGSPKPVQVADSGQIATDTQLAQDETQGEVSVGYATARVILQRQVAEGIRTQAEADELLGRIKTGDAQASAAVNAALRGYARVPKNWTAEATDGPGGVYYRNPENPDYDYVRIMPGKPQSSNPAQQEPYVVDQKNGRFLTQAGDRVEGNDDESTHIPLGDYRFDKR